MNMYNPYYPYYMPANQFAYPSTYGQPYMGAKMNNMYAPMYGHPQQQQQQTPSGASAGNNASTSPTSSSTSAFNPNSAAKSSYGYGNYSRGATGNEYDDSAFAQTGDVDPHHSSQSAYSSGGYGQQAAFAQQFQQPVSYQHGVPSSASGQNASSSSASSFGQQSGLNASSSDYANVDAMNPYRKAPFSLDKIYELDCSHYEIAKLLPTTGDELLSI